VSTAAASAKRVSVATRRGRAVGPLRTLDERIDERISEAVTPVASIDGHPQDPTTAIFLRKE
jgi:hypothetical protein